MITYADLLETKGMQLENELLRQDRNQWERRYRLLEAEKKMKPKQTRRKLHGKATAKGCFGCNGTVQEVEAEQSAYLGDRFWRCAACGSLMILITRDPERWQRPVEAKEP